MNIRGKKKGKKLESYKRHYAAGLTTLTALVTYTAYVQAVQFIPAVSKVVIDTVVENLRAGAGLGDVSII